ncbi:MAG: hypothetical protein ACI4EF_04140 [Coprococcus sp.]
MGIEAIKELRNIFLEFNSEIVKCVCEEIKKRRDEQCVVWFCNTRDNSKCKVEVRDQEILIGEDAILDKYGCEFILYLWVEYGDEKIAYFYKDIDTKTLNIHVIPGVIQHYRKISINDSIPELKYENECLHMINVPKSSQFLPFAERFEECLWVPDKIESDAILRLQKMKDFDRFSDKLRNQLMIIRKDANIILSEIEGVESSLRGGLGVKPKYSYIEWINAKIKDIPFSLNMFHINYIKDVGIFTAFDVINITEVIEKGRINVRDTADESTVVVRYDIEDENQKNVKSFHFSMERLYDSSFFIKPILENHFHCRIDEMTEL